MSEINEETRALYARAREHYGDDHQLLKLGEEAAELAATVLRWAVTGELAGVYEELADVEITGEQFRENFGTLHVDAWHVAKLARLKARLDEAGA